jgi:ATP synthase protein I
MEQENTKKIKSSAFSNSTKWQIIITIALTILFLPIAGLNAGISALLGGVSVMVGSYAGMRMVGTNFGTDSNGYLIVLLKAEALKIVIITILLFLIFKLYQGLIPLSLIGGLAGSALASGAGLRTKNNDKK